jgi:hypothetical protein
MIKKIFTNKTVIVLSILISMSYGQSKSLLNNLRIEPKQNGIFLTIQSSSPLKIENIIGWVNDDWFYITVHEAVGDSISIQTAQYSYPVITVENTNAEESTQIALRLHGKIENFEFYLSDNKQTIIAALYYSAESVVALLEEKQLEDYSSYKLNSRLKSVFYLTGGALTISGVISGDGSKGNNTELALGLTILACTYFYDLVTK